MELLAGAVVVLGIVAILVRFAPGSAAARIRLPVLVDQSVGMWAVRRIRARVRQERGSGRAVADRPRDLTGPTRSSTSFPATPTRLAAIGARRATPLPRSRFVLPASPVKPGQTMPSRRGASTTYALKGSAVRPSAVRPSGLSTATSRPLLATRPAAPSAGRGPAASARRSRRMTLRSLHLTAAAAVLTIGLSLLVGIAAILNAPQPSGGVLAATGHPEPSVPPSTAPAPSRASDVPASDVPASASARP